MTEMTLIQPDLGRLAQLRWVHLELTHQLQDDLTLDAPFTVGALYRSVLGLGLKKYSPEAFFVFFGDHTKVPRPWWCWAAETHSTIHLPAGTYLPARLSIQETALPHLSACLQAFTDFVHHGLGRQRIPALLTDVKVMAPTGVQTLTEQAPPCWSADTVWQVAQQEAAQWVAPVQIQTHSPLYLKEDNQPLRHAPSLETLIVRCMGRAKMLLPLDSGSLMSHQAKMDWQTYGRCILPQEVALLSTGVSRYSARQGRAMYIEGLCGRWSYPPESLAALPWLRLAEHLQLGGKSTLGFGAVQVQDSSTLPLATSSPPYAPFQKSPCHSDMPKPLRAFNAPDTP